MRSALLCAIATGAVAFSPSVLHSIVRQQAGPRCAVPLMTKKGKKPGKKSDVPEDPTVFTSSLRPPFEDKGMGGPPDSKPIGGPPSDRPILGGPATSPTELIRKEQPPFVDPKTMGGTGDNKPVTGTPVPPPPKAPPPKPPQGAPPKGAPPVVGLPEGAKFVVPGTAAPPRKPPKDPTPPVKRRASPRDNKPVANPPPTSDGFMSKDQPPFLDDSKMGGTITGSTGGPKVRGKSTTYANPSGFTYQSTSGVTPNEKRVPAPGGAPVKKTPATPFPPQDTIMRRDVKPPFVDQNMGGTVVDIQTRGKSTRAPAAPAAPAPAAPARAAPAPAMDDSTVDTGSAAATGGGSGAGDTGANAMVDKVTTVLKALVMARIEADASNVGGEIEEALGRAEAAVASLAEAVAAAEE